MLCRLALRKMKHFHYIFGRGNDTVVTTAKNVKESARGFSKIPYLDGRTVQCRLNCLTTYRIQLKVAYTAALKGSSRATRIQDLKQRADNRKEM